MGFDNLETVAMVTCDKGGQHQGEYISLICLNPLCRNECLICCICKTTKHKDHSTFPLKTLFDDLEFKSKKLERKSELMVLSEIERAQATSLDGVHSLGKYVQAKMQKMEDKMLNFFQNLRNETTIHFNNRPMWANEIERLRFESDKDHLEVKIQEVLDNITIGEGKIAKLNEEFFGSKSTEPIDGFVQSFLETLKNIHVAISSQYSKMYNPQSQPHHLRKDYFQNPNTIAQLNQMNFQQQKVNGKTHQQKNSDVPFKGYSQMNSEPVSKAYSQKNCESNNKNYDTASFSSKTIPPQQAQQSNNNISNLNYNTEVKLGSNYPRNPTFSGFVNNNEQNAVLSGDNFSQNNGNTASSNVKQQINDSAMIVQNNPFFAMQQSTVSHNIPNIPQFQQLQIDLQRQINQQQQLLLQLQLQNANNNTQSTQSTPLNAFALNQISQQYNQSDFRRNWSIPKTSIESVASQTLSNIMRSGSPSPPQRLMYYSSLFQQHMQSRQSQQQTPYSGAVFQRNTSQPKLLSLTPSITQLNNNQQSQQNSSQLIQQNSTSNQQNDRKSNFGYQNQNQNNNNNYYEQDLDVEDFENQKFKDLPKSQERKFRFRFHKEYIHENLETFDSQRKVRGKSDNFETRLALMSPSVETKPIREFHWAIKIVNCKSMAYSSPLAIGICLKKHLETNQFRFIGEDKQSMGSNTGIRSTQSFNRLSYGSSMIGSQSGSSTIASKNDISPHGCYLLTAAGFIRNHTESKQDMKKVQVRFDKGDILLCHFNPFRKYLKIKNKNSGEYCMINIDFTPGDQLFPCARISYSQDVVEIVDETE